MKQHIASLQRFGAILGILSALMLGSVQSHAESPVLHSDGANIWVMIPLDATGTFALHAAWEGDQGDITRTNPDGSMWQHWGSSQATITVLYRGPDSAGKWLALATGTGLMNAQVSGIANAAGRFQPNGEVFDMHCVGELEVIETGEVGGVKFTGGDVGQFNFTRIIRDGTLFLYRLRYAPFDDDYKIHKP